MNKSGNWIGTILTIIGVLLVFFCLGHIEVLVSGIFIALIGAAITAFSLREDSSDQDLPK